MNENILIKAIEEIRDTSKKWEGRSGVVPYWNLGDKAAVALKRYNQALDHDRESNAVPKQNRKC